MPVAESLTMLHAVREHIDYGRVRLWGSISFMLATFAGGALLEAWSTDVILWAITACTAVTILVAAGPSWWRGAAARSGNSPATR